MKSLANIKLSQTIRTNLLNFCEAYKEASSENPTIGILAAAFGVPDLGHDLNETVNDVYIRKTTIFLSEAVLDIPVREVEGKERKGREAELGFEGATQLIDPAMRDMVSSGKSAEEAGVNMDKFMEIVTDAELTSWLNARKNAVNKTDTDLEALKDTQQQTARIPQPKPITEPKPVEVPFAEPETKPAEIDIPTTFPIVPTTKPEIRPETKPETETETETETEIETTPETRPEVKPKTKPETETEIETEDEIKTRIARALDTKLKTISGVDIVQDRELIGRSGSDSDTKIKLRRTPEEKTEPFDREPTGRGALTTPKTGEQSKPVTSKQDKNKPEPLQAPQPDLGDVRYHALVARGAPQGGSVVLPVYEEVYNPKLSLKKKSQKQQYKVVVVQEGGKKVEIFAKSIRGIKRAVYGKQNYRVFDSKGSDITGYFKRTQKKGK